MSSYEIRERNRSHTRKGPGVMPFRKTPKPCRIAATGPGSINADSEMFALIRAGKREEAAKYFEKHKAVTHKSDAWRHSKLESVTCILNSS